MLIESQRDYVTGFNMTTYDILLLFMRYNHQCLILPHIAQSCDYGCVNSTSLNFFFLLCFHFQSLSLSFPVIIIVFSKHYI